MKQLMLAACLLGLAGCGDGTAEVRGKVTFNGKPVENGTIVFESEDRNGPTHGVPITNGAYQMAGPNRVPAGAKLVRIQAFGPSGRKVSAAPGSTAMVDEFKPLIPAKYDSASTLKVTVEAGKENTHDFELTP